MMTRLKQSMRLFVLCALLCASLFTFETIADAASQSNAKGSLEGSALIATSYRATLSPGGTMKYKIGFKNTSKKAWTPGKGKLIVVSGVTRESWLHSPTWLTKTAAARITERIEPGRIGYAEFVIEAPKKNGTYSEKFSLAVDGKRRRTTALTLTVDVKKNSAKAPAVVAVVAPPPAVSLVSATRLIQSNAAISLPRDGRMVFRVGYKNTGKTPWTSSSQLTLRSRAIRESYFADESWASGSTVAAIKDSVKPGELLIVSFVIHAPVVVGTFQERFTLYQGATPLPETQFDIPLTVTQTPSVVLASASNSDAMSDISKRSEELNASAGNAIGQEAATSTQSMVVHSGIIDDKQEQEPIIRAGLFSSPEPIVLTANKPFVVLDARGSTLFSEAAQSIVTISFDASSKSFTVGDASATSTAVSFVRLSGTVKGADGRDDQDTIFEIRSYQHRPTWNQSLNDNLFRGVIEVRYAPPTDRVWVINELQLEQYLKGIAESSNNAPYEYHKALMVAARTYAKYHINRSTKYASEGYTVRTTDADQVYRGYGSEMRLPNVARAVQETRGVMVFYNNLLAITPYFSQSDGRTRSWEEVWAGGPKGWLIGKDDPSNKGLPLLGHGVGMSARGAVNMASKGKTFEEILTYYFTGVELHRRY